MGAPPPRAGALRDLRFDLEPLRRDLARLRALPELASRTQISLVHRPGAADPYGDGAGSLWNEDAGAARGREAEFTEFHRAWRESSFGEAHRRLREATGFELGRFRVLVLEPRRCYSIHEDTEIRLHIPLISNSQAFILFGDCPPLHFAADGRAYWADTRQAHSAMNGHGQAERVHLVASVIETSRRTCDDFLREQRGE